LFDPNINDYNGFVEDNCPYPGRNADYYKEH
jgi:hypothetical protein